MSVSSILSTRSTGWKIDVRLASLMDSIFTISFGLGLRFIIDAVSDHDFKITGTLVGLWEGVIMLHFTKKRPKSSDPFIAYGMRLFVDFLFTESVARLVLVLVWTALGMVLADVTPAIWYEVGLRRVWRRFRRDIYSMLQSIPAVAFFPPTRTVRFSPSREPSIITDANADAVPPPSVITTEQAPTTNTVPTTTAPAAREIFRRRVPGYFPADFSDTETEPGSVHLGPSPGERTGRRLSVYPGNHDFEDSVSSQNDLDEENLSSSSVSSDSTERPGVSSTGIDASIIPDMYVEEEPLVNVVAAPVKDEEEIKTPKQSAAPYMPPTPSDSAMHLFHRQSSEDPLVVRPPIEFMPQIPDFLDEANTEDWEKIQRQEATEEKPPTPPAKDPTYTLKTPIIPAPVPPQPQLQRSTPSPEDETKGWDLLDSQFISNPNDSNNATFNDHHQGQVYEFDDDDMYGDLAPEYSTLPAFGESSATGPPPVHTNDFTSGILQPDTMRTDPWFGVDEKKRMEEEAERQRREDEEAARRQQEEEDVLKGQEEEAAEAKRLEEERLKEKKAQEKAERLRKEVEDDAIRKKKREDDEAAERKRKEDEEAAAELKRKEDEEAEKQRRKDEERQRKEEEKRRRKEEAEQKKAEEKQRKKEEVEQKQREEVERKRREEEMAKEKAKKLAEAAEAKRLKEEEAEKKRLEEEAYAMAKAAADAQAIAEEEERRKEEEALAKRKIEEESEAARVKAEEEARLLEEKQTKEQEEAEQRREAEEWGRTEATQAEPLPPSETRLPNDAEQDPEKDLPPQPLETQADEESAVSEASETPNEPSDRLDRMMLLRAQMVQVEGRLNNLSPESDQEIKQTEKILRKMRRQAERRYATGTSFAQYMDNFDEDDTILLDGFHPKTAEQKIEEKLEALLSPDADSLFVKIAIAKKASEAKKQKPNVVMLLERYNLTPYTSESADNKKISIVNIPEEKFADWLTGYRILSTRKQDPDEDPDDFSVWRS